MFPSPDPSSQARLVAEISRELPARYRLLGYLGQGAFATVWQAYDRLNLRPVAIKRFASLRGQRRSDFYKELAALALLEHERIVALYDLRETEEGRQYLILEYCDGGTLRRAIERQPGPWTPDVVARIGHQVAQGLEAAHRLGLTHRDLKPENLLFATNQHLSPIKIADFGLARTRRGLDDGRLVGLTGSPAYMAPEQYQGKWCLASDMYAYGVILYELLHGRLPFQGSPGELARQHLYERPRISPLLPRPWPELLERLLVKVPEYRPTATECVIRLSAMENRRMGNPEREKALQRDMQQLRSTLRLLADFGEPTMEEPEQPEEEQTPAVSPSELLERSREQLARIVQAARQPRESRYPQATPASHQGGPAPVASVVDSDVLENQQQLAPGLQSAQSLFADASWGEAAEDEISADEELPLGMTPGKQTDHLGTAEATTPPPDLQRNAHDVFSQFGW
ncbi:MAG: serine/threonine-protein kinase [Gemmataceae bacterium]